jgi:hypothetical protein
VVVSKKTLSLMRCVPIKGEASGQGAALVAGVLLRFLSCNHALLQTPVAQQFKSRSDLFQGFDNGWGEPDG